MTGACTLAMLAVIYGMPKGTVVTIPRSEIEQRGYTSADVARGKRCCRERKIECRVAEDR